MRTKIEQIAIISAKYIAIKNFLNERGRRAWAASEAISIGRGGISLVCKGTRLSSATVCKGMKELRDPNTNTDRIRKAGGGRKKISEQQNNLLKEIEKMLEPSTKGDPESLLLWTSKSTRNIAQALTQNGYKISYRTVARLLHELGYSLQANKKTLSTSTHADRDQQFKYINESALAMQKLNCPVISVDTKKKELIGNYKNNGQEFSKKYNPTKVKDHDFPDAKLGKVVPYGIYDLGKNKGWVSVGISGDTAEFAVNSIRTWWYNMGKAMYPEAGSILITADCGGSNGYRVRLWKLELQKLADELKLQIKIRHFPPGTSKWNKIEHRLFSYISKNWRGQPLISREAVVSLIANTKTSKGLEVKAVLDENQYVLGKTVSDDLFNSLNISGDPFHPEWNYTISPKENPL